MAARTTGGRSAWPRQLFFLCAASLVLMVPAFINGYPLVYSDTSTYLASGFTWQPPFDRPITYGAFVRIFSLNGLSLWTVIAVQSLLLAWLLTGLVRVLLPGHATAFLAVLFAGLLGSLSWTASQLMPDIFTPVMILSALLLLVTRPGRVRRVFLYFVFFLSAAMHSSHPPLALSFLVLVMVLWLSGVRGLKEGLRLKAVPILAVLALASMLSMGSALSKSRHVFFMGAMVEHGIAQAYLDAHCGDADYRLCAYRDSLPTLAWQFVWDENSPLYRVGGWKESKEEFQVIIRGSLRSPRFLRMHIRESFKATAVQLGRFRIGDGNGIFGEGSLLYERVGRYVPGELEAYSRSLQNRGKLGFIGWFNRLQYFLVLLALPFLVWLYIRPPGRIPALMFRLTVPLLLLAILLNAWIIGTFSGSVDRQGAKLMWLIPLLAAAGILALITGNTTRALSD